MLRNIAAVIAGFLIGNVLVYLVELINRVIAPFPAGMKMDDIAAFRAWIVTLPTAAFIVVLCAWAVGAFGGTLTTAAFARGPRMILACIIGAFFWFATLINLILIPGPLYMWLGLAIVPVMTIAGARLGIRLNPTKPSGPQLYDMRKKGMACK